MGRRGRGNPSGNAQSIPQPPHHVAGYKAAEAGAEHAEELRHMFSAKDGVDVKAQPMFVKTKICMMLPHHLEYNTVGCIQMRQLRKATNGAGKSAHRDKAKCPAVCMFAYLYQLQALKTCLCDLCGPYK